MLAAESVKQRLPSGLSFIEFNYALLQAYDFYHLFKTANCLLQMGGRDQWGNIVAGIELIRRMAGGEAFGLTFPLITTASGAKMGKTAQGAIWLDKKRTSPYTFYQYWINTDDQDVEKFLKLFTFLPLKDIETLCRHTGAELRSAKEVLAFEVTALCHGRGEAAKARAASQTVFGGPIGETDALPIVKIPLSRLEKGIPAFELVAETGAAGSRSAARRLIAQGGAYLNSERIHPFDKIITHLDLVNGVLLLRTGKKKHIKIIAHNLKS